MSQPHCLKESKGKVHHKFQNIVGKNNQPHLVNASTGSNMTDPAGSDYAAIKVVTEPLASAPPDASVLCFEHLTEHCLHTKLNLKYRKLQWRMILLQRLVLKLKL